jgi:hypothetical protein
MGFGHAWSCRERWEKEQGRHRVKKSEDELCFQTVVKSIDDNLQRVMADASLLYFKFLF